MSGPLVIGEPSLENSCGASHRGFESLSLRQAFRSRASRLLSVDAHNAIRELGTSDALHALTVKLVDPVVDRLFNRPKYGGANMLAVTTAATESEAIGGTLRRVMCVGCRADWEHPVPPEFGVREFDIFKALAWLLRQLKTLALATASATSRAVARRPKFNEGR